MITRNDLRSYFNSKYGIDIKEDVLQKIESHFSNKNSQYKQDFTQRLESFKINKNVDRYTGITYGYTTSPTDISHTTKFRKSKYYHSDSYPQYTDTSNEILTKHIINNPNAHEEIRPFQEAWYNNFISDYLSFSIKEDLPDEVVKSIDDFKQTAINPDAVQEFNLFKGLITSSPTDPMDKELQTHYQKFVNQRENTMKQIEQTRLKMLDREGMLRRPRQGSGIIAQISPDFFRNFFKVSRR